MIIRKMNIASGLVLLSLIVLGCNNEMGKQDSGYQVEGVRYTDVRLTGGLLGEKSRLVREVTLPHVLEMCRETGRIRNFIIAGSLADGSYCTRYHFDDSDVFKAIEAASYQLAVYPDKKLEAEVDSIITYMALAQEPDGYLYTNRTIMGDSAHKAAGPERWLSVSGKSHELYNMGHLIEAGVAHFEATGKKTLLEVALKSADLICDTFGYGKLELYPGHQEIELALVRLFRLTGEQRYLETAAFFLDIRGPGGDEYLQAHLKVEDQHEAVGHAVRAMYLYSAMTDISASLPGNRYRETLNSLWNDVTERKMYITGGTGPGTGHSEGFGPPWFLPDTTAYCETCSSIGNILWNYRLFRTDPQSKYYDVIEKVLYNSFLSGLSASGDRYFYTNPLGSNGSHERKEWYPCSCCPPNIARLTGSLPGYIYAVRGRSIYINLYSACDADIELEGKDRIRLQQVTDYPWSGTVSLQVNCHEGTYFDLRMRIPGWQGNSPLPGDLYSYINPDAGVVKIYIDDQPADYIMENGYAVIEREWKGNEDIVVEFDIQPRIVEADIRVESVRDRVALQRGPMVYCLEWPDNPGIKIAEAGIMSSFDGEVVYDQSVPGGMVYITSKDNALRFIPYYNWANRGIGEMRVWINKLQSQDSE